MMKPKQVTCLDIAINSVKFIQASKAKNRGLTIESSQYRVFDTKDDMAKAVEQCVVDAAFLPTQICTSIWSPTLITRKIAMPLMSQKALAAAVPVKAEELIPFPVEQSILDHYVIHEDLSAKTMEVMLIAAKKDLIVERCQFLEKIGLNLGLMDIHPTSLNNYYCQNEKFSKSEPFVLIQVGDEPGKIKGEDCYLSVVENGISTVIRDLGDKLSAETVQDEDWASIKSHITNAVIFYENLKKQKVKKYIISAADSVFVKLKSLFHDESEIQLVHWKAESSVLFDSSMNKDDFMKHEFLFKVCLGQAVRGLY